ncbi:MAG TPA: hypothetical protein VKR83_00395 [Ktedonobacteraceae bacterium]|nr:hypothetical protein [Ktedonobacteraceae bacterium]
MSPVLLTLLSLIAYICGLVVLLRVTPLLLKRRFDEGLFMGMAAADIFGGLLVFAPVGVSFALFNGSITVRIFDVILLLIIGIVALRIAYRSLRPHYMMDVIRVSGVLVGSYFLLLTGLAIYAIVLLFMM